MVFIWLTWLLLIVVGLVLGSFVTAMSYRLAREDVPHNARSCCPACGHPLGVKDLVPVFSWLCLKGRCRYCEAPVHWRYPAIELATVGMVLLTYAGFGWTASGLLLLTAGVVFLVMIVADLENFILPDACQWALLALAVLWHTAHPIAWGDAWGGLLLAGGVALLLHYGYYLLKGRHGLGFGDVKLLAIAGFWLGLFWVPQFLLGAGLAGVIFGLVWRRFHTDSPYFPFGPALIASLWAALAMRELVKTPWLYN